MDEVSGSSQEDTNQCRYCKLPMPRAAVVCTKCGNHRLRWRNELKYFGGVVGLFTALAAGVTYVVTNAPEVKKVLDWKESVAILRLSYSQGLVIHNQGYGQIFVRDITVTAKQFQSDEKLYSLTLKIDRAVPAGETLAFEFDEVNRNKKITDEYWSILGTESDDQFAKAVRLSGGPRELEKGIACYKQLIYSADDPYFKNYQESLGSRLRTYPATAHVQFLSTRFNRLMSQEIKVFGVLAEAPDKRCQVSR